MKRPFACIGFSMLVSLVFAVEFGYTAAAYCAVVCFILLAVFLFAKFVCKKNTLSPAVCTLAACLSLASFSLMITYYVNPLIEKYDGEYVELTATVTSKPYTENGNTYFNVKTTTINGEEKHINLQISTNYALPINYYDTLIINTQLYSDYESGYSYASYYGARNIFLKAYINTYYGGSYEVVENDSKPLYCVFTSMRETISNTLQKYLTYDEASVCTAVITGEKIFLSDDIYSRFKNLGVSHILVVSGLHLSLIAGILYKITEKTIKNRFASAAVQIIGIIAYAALSGFGFSVIRAGIMSVVLVLSRLCYSKADALNSLGAAAAVLCLNPMNVGDIGLLWSFSCVLSLILFANPINDFLVKHLDVGKIGFITKVISLLSSSAAAFIGSLPFFILVTGSLSPYTIIINILIVPFTGIIILCGGVSVLLFAIGINAAAYPLIYVCGLTVKYILFVINSFSKLPMSSVGTNKIYVYIWFAVCIAVFTLIYFIDKNKHYLSVGTCAAAAVLIALYSFDTILNYDKITFSILDVGDGLTATLTTNNSIVLLNSYGEKYQYSTIKAELSDYEYIDCMVDTSPNNGIYNYCEKIAVNFDIHNILLHDIDKFDTDYCYARYKGVNTELIGDNYTLYIGDNATLRLVTYGDFTWEYLTVYGFNILICPKNADASELALEFQTADIAVISDLPENFDLINAELFVISNYGDECSEIYNAVSETGCTAEMTNGLGRIDFTFDSSGNFSADRGYTGGVTRYGSDN